MKQKFFVKSAIKWSLLFLFVGYLGQQNGNLGFGEIVRLSTLFIALMIQKSYIHNLADENNKIPTKKGETFPMFFNAICFTFFPLIYVATSWFDFANYQLGQNIQIIGTIISITSLIILYKAHSDLGANWSPIVEIQKEQNLVQEGIYKFVRHPIYFSVFLASIGQLLLLGNWLIGPAALVGFTWLYLARIGNEEDTLISKFGDDYIEYSKRTGGLFPKFFHGKKEA